MDLQKIFKSIKKRCILPLIPTLLIAVPSFLLLIWVFADLSVPQSICYVAYVLSSYALIITCTGVFRLTKWFRSEMEENYLVKKLKGISFVERYVKESAFRAEISLYPGLFINLLYAGLKLFSGICYRSVWFGTLAVYYILLAVMRFSLLHHVRTKEAGEENRIRELYRCRMCGIVLMILDWALAGMTILVVRKNSGFTYPGMLIYLMAMYTFYAVITAVRNVIRFRKYGSPVLSAAKVINLTADVVSMRSLETAMLPQFGAAGDAAFRQRMTALTGTAVCLIVLGMAVTIIIRTTVQIGNIKNGNKKREVRERGKDSCSGG